MAGITAAHPAAQCGKARCAPPMKCAPQTAAPRRSHCALQHHVRRSPPGRMRAPQRESGTRFPRCAQREPSTYRRCRAAPTCSCQGAHSLSSSPSLTNCAGCQRPPRPDRHRSQQRLLARTPKNHQQCRTFRQPACRLIAQMHEHTLHRCRAAPLHEATRGRCARGARRHARCLPPPPGKGRHKTPRRRSPVPVAQHRTSLRSPVRMVHFHRE